MAIVEIARVASSVSSTTAVASYSGSDITGGHIIVAYAQNDDLATTTPDLTDTDTNTYSISEQFDNGSNVAVVVYHAQNAGTISNGHQFTVTNDIAVSRKLLIVYHVDNLDNSGLVHETGTGSSLGSTTPSATLDASTTEPDTLTFGAACVVSDGSLGWTPDGTDGDVADILNRSLVTSFTYRNSNAAHTEGGTIDVSGAWRAVIVAYKVASSGTPTSAAYDARARGSASSDTTRDARVEGLGSYQYAVALTDSADGNWTDHTGGTSLAAQLDELSPNDSDYIQSEIDPSNSGTRIGPLTLRNSSQLLDPDVSNNHTINWRVGKDTTGGPTIDVTVKLYQGGGNTLGGGTLIADFVRTNVDALTTYSETLSGGETDAITDYSDLYLEFWADAS